MEWNSATSDMNPYFPVPPCEHGGPLQVHNFFLPDTPNGQIVMEVPYRYTLIETLNGFAGLFYRYKIVLLPKTLN